jgi:hypothetical protein
VDEELTIDLASLDVLLNILGAATVNLAANGERSSENLKDGTLEGLGHGAGTHGAGHLNNLVEGDGLVVLDVLLLLAVTRGLLEGLDDQGRGGGNDRDGSPVSIVSIDALHPMVEGFILSVLRRS